ncbi:calcium-binding protein [Microvirga splendida]|uniref:Calcium-binding protein n=1 Tax=Microvirga splendida TaxID=2795727 RepID=A0ABS0XWE7_9HYPH|nr:calcium-binding protein [Microvirga splendida]MBJ6124377.1 calcium-binding protein [Microvirga splendida]
MAIIFAKGDTLGTARSDKIYGTDGGESLIGLGGNDWIQGNRGKDFLWGGAGNDSIWGGSGDDFIVGGTGRDLLSGYGGRDSFVFDWAPSRSNVDRITDFNARYDTIVLSTAVFKGAGGANRDMKASAFWVGTAAHDASDRIIHDRAAGALYYDPDGTGSRAAIQFAKIDANLRLTYKDFFMMAP